MCHRKNFLLGRVTLFSCKNNVTNRYFPKEEMSCHRKFCFATVRNFLSQEEFLATIRNFLPQEEISCHKLNCHRKKFLVTGRNFLSQELGGNFMSQWVVFIQISIYFWKKFPVHVEISYDNISFTGRKSLQRKKFALLIEIYFQL